MPFFFIKCNAAKMKHFYILLPSRLFLRYLCTITPILYLHTFHVMVHSPACKTAHMAGTPVRNMHTHRHTSTCTQPCLQDRTYGRYAGQEHAHTQTHKYMYTALPTRPHIWQVRRTGTCTHTDTHVYTCIQPCLQDRTYGRYAGQEHAHTQTHKYMYTALPTRPHIWQVRRTGTCTHTDTQVHVHSPAYKTAHMAGTPVRDVHTHRHISTCTQPCLYTRLHIWLVRRSGTCTYRYTSTCTQPCLQDRTYGRYAGQGHAHTQTHKYMYMYTALPTRPHIWKVLRSRTCTYTQTHKHMYTALPTIPHIWQVRRSGTCTHTDTQVHVHSPAYKTAHMAGTPVRDMHTHRHTSTCTQPCLQDCTYGRYARQGHAHTQTHKYMYTALPTRPHIWQVHRSGTCIHRHTSTCTQPCLQDHTYTPVRDMHTHTDTQVHVHIPAYKTTYMAGTQVRDMHTHRHTSTCTHPCLQDLTYGRDAGQGHAHTTCHILNHRKL